MSITEEEANEASDGLETEDDDSNEDEDLSQDSNGEEIISKELQEFNLPVEVWIHVWNFLDFNTRQKICTLVSKTWLNQIRNSSILSGEMKILRTYYKKFEDCDIADAVMSRWKKLKVLHIENEMEIQRFGNFTEHKLLEKIVILDNGQNSPRNKLKFIYNAMSFNGNIAGLEQDSDDSYADEYDYYDQLEWGSADFLADF